MINRFFCITILILVSIGLYLPTLQYDFVFDDHSLIKENKWLSDTKNLPDIFLSSSWAFRENAKANTYRPMQHVILMLEYFLFGLKAWGYHLVNILLHTGNTLLVFFLASFIFKTRQMTNDKKAGAQLSCGYFATVPAFFTALLFTAHPINTEAVAWITTVIELSMTSFYLLSFYLYVTSSPGWNIRFTGSVGLFALAVFSKEPALTLLFIILLYDYSKQNALSVIKEYRKYIPYLMVAAGYMALRIYAFGGDFIAEEKTTMGFGQLILNAFPLFLQYIQKLILPVDLTAIYVFYPVQSLTEWKVIGAIALTILFAVFWYFVRTRDRVIFLGLSFIAIPLLPVFYLPQIRDIVFSEFYLYLPSFGFALLLSYALVEIAGRLGNKGFNTKKVTLVRINKWAVVFFVLIIGVYSMATMKRHVVWRNDLSLWSDTIKKSPDSSIAYNNLGSVYIAEGRWDDAIREFKKAVEISPYNASFHFKFGNVYFAKDLWDQAIVQYKEALKIYPNYSRAHFRLGNAYYKKGLLDQAILEYKKTIKIDPGFLKAYNNLGGLYMKKGLLDLAIEEYKKALRINPDYEDAKWNLRRAYNFKKSQSGSVITKKRVPRRH